MSTMTFDKDFEHVITKVLKQQIDSPLVKSLTYVGISDLTDWIGSDMTTFDNIKYQKDPNKSTLTPLPEGHTGKIRSFKRWYHYLTSQGKTPCGKWDQLTSDDFDDFRMS